MKNLYFNVDGVALKRINKHSAMMRYYKGEDVLFIPCNLRQDSPWRLGIWENKGLDGQHSDFTSLYNAFSYYNCNNETGKYIAFYVRET